MRARLTLLAILLVGLTGLTIAQGSPGAAADRKITSRIAPTYPELAKKMRLQGIVKVEAVVRPNGTVRATRVVGGNPVLVESATDAIRKWKFEVGPIETTEVIQLSFVPE